MAPLNFSHVQRPHTMRPKSLWPSRANNDNLTQIRISIVDKGDLTSESLVPFSKKCEKSLSWFLSIFTLKVSKFRKQFICSHLNQRTNEIVFWFLPLPLIMGQIKKWRHFICFRSLGQKSKNNFIRFLVQMRTTKSSSEIYWPVHTDRMY